MHQLVITIIFCSNLCLLIAFVLYITNRLLFFSGHKLQGRTLETTDIVCHGDEKLDYGEGYVMLSRAKNIEQVFLDESFIPEKHLKVHEASLKEAKRIDQECNAKKLKSERYDIFIVNMRARSNFIDVQHDLFAKQSSLVCLTQTGFSANEVLQWPGKRGQPEEYDPKRRCFPHASFGEGKGVCCLTDEEQNTSFIAKLAREKYQLVKEIMRDRFQIFIIYVSPNANHQVYQELSEDLDEMIWPGLEPIFIGDFNFDAKNKNPLSSYLHNELGMKQIVNEPTYALGPNIIDHIYIRPYMEEKISLSYRYNYYTDHCSFNLSMK